jgi:group II intron reverse transcriptase/maturase
MRSAETILAVIRERGRQGLPLERVYRFLFNRDLYLRAYARLYPNKGAMTKGSTDETVDGMSLAKIDTLIDALRYERHRWTPVRRVHIPKPRGKGRRPLGIPSWSDKLLQEVLRSILEAYYEPQFSARAHGFRPNRGCHTALSDIQQTWTGTRWFIEGDIAKYFDTINHDKLIAMLGEQIHDGRVLRLLRELLAAGYLEDWTVHPTLSGAPQGGIVSPILSNIYLHRFDQWVETTLIPAYTRGTRRRDNPAYRHLSYRMSVARKTGDKRGTRELLKQRRTLPSSDTRDPNYRRLRYIRYADDFLLGFSGTHEEAEDIKRQIAAWLHDNLDLTLSAEKTLITHSTTQAARFLGYDISVMHIDHKLDWQKHRSSNGTIALRVPADVIERKRRRYMRKGKVMHRPQLLDDSDHTIIVQYQQEYRGLVQYYLLAQNVSWFHRLHWVMRISLLKTLAAKHRSTIGKMLLRHATTTVAETGERLICLEARVERAGRPPLIARFGGILLRPQPTATLDDRPFAFNNPGTELITRLLTGACELCGSTDHIEVHHIRKLADLDKPGRKKKPAWVKRMAARRRKTLVVCRSCHDAIHAGRPTRQRNAE